jgi:hypothetical protein
MNHIKEILSGNQDQEFIHQKFVKYSKGNFVAAALNLKKAGDKLKVKGSCDYSDVVGYILAKASSGPVKVSGAIASKKEIKTTLPLAKGKKRLGVVTTEIKTDLDAKDLVALYEQNPEAHLLIDIESSAGKLKTKKKPPRPGGGIDDEFFSAEIQPSAIPAFLEETCFDFENKNFAEAKVIHTYSITEIVIPEEYRKDAAKARLHSKRKGTVKRTIETDGRKTEKTKDLLV